MFDALARLAHRRARRTLVLTFVFAVVAGALGGPVAGLLSADREFEDHGSDSSAVREDLGRATGVAPDPAVVVLLRPGVPVTGAEGRARTARLERDLVRDRAVARVASFPQTRDRALVSRDGRATYLPVFLRSGVDADDTADRLAQRFEPRPGVTVGGYEHAYSQVTEQVEEDLRKAEMLAFPLLFLLSLWFFRSLVAASLPLFVGGVSIVGTFLVLRVVNAYFDLSVFAISLVTGLGLGLAIDYSLFVVSRYREELARAGPGLEALRATLATAGRTVLFSSLTVAAALASLLLFPLRFLQSMAVGGVVITLLGATIALVALPALLSVLGPRVDSLALGRWRRAAQAEARPASAGFWYRLSRAVMRRPGRIAVASAVLLLALGVPFLDIRFTGVDATVLPQGTSSREVEDAIREDFPPNRTAPVTVVAHAPRAAREEVGGYVRRLGRLDGVRAIGAPVALPGDRWRIDVVSRAASLDETSKELVQEVRDVSAPFPVQVGGQSAEFVDQRAALGRSLPIALAVLALTTIAILFLMTGSVVLPLKALVMNVLTLSAAFGLLVVVFQDGRLEGVLDYTSQGALESTQPVLLFAVAFGLSTDYGVFLLGRIKEARDRGLPDREAVATGLERTGRIVTAAAILFCTAIGAFATSEIVFIKELGVGTALAVILDATIVRALLVPALMQLLGARNWWAPRPLRRLHRRFGLAEGEPGVARA